VTVNATIHVHYDDPKTAEAFEAVQARLGLLLEATNRVLIQGASLMAASDDMKADLGKIDAATNNIAADIQRLKDKISSSMSPADVADVKSALARTVTRLEGLAADPSNPDPTPEPQPQPEPEPEPPLQP